ncbi:MAG: hypothetical protein ACYTFI_08145 [Planctomycetota bacterium]|jgi:hypothetical protein
MTCEGEERSRPGAEQDDSFARLCREMAEKMDCCGPMMERMMAAFVAVAPGDAPCAKSTEEPDA